MQMLEMQFFNDLWRGASKGLFDPIVNYKSNDSENGEKPIDRQIPFFSSCDGPRFDNSSQSGCNIADISSTGSNLSRERLIIQQIDDIEVHWYN